MKCPYNAIELTTALWSASRKLEEYEKTNGEGSVLKKIDELGMTTPATGAELNKRTADYQGISVDTLVNSPNYEKLQQEYGWHMVQQVRKAVMDNFGLDDKEAWAVVLQEEVDNAIKNL